jgi:hypothetical protein
MKSLITLGALAEGSSPLITCPFSGGGRSLHYLILKASLDLGRSELKLEYQMLAPQCPQEGKTFLIQFFPVFKVLSIG